MSVIDDEKQVVDIEARINIIETRIRLAEVQLDDIALDTLLSSGETPAQKKAQADLASAKQALDTAQRARKTAIARLEKSKYELRVQQNETVRKDHERLANKKEKATTMLMDAAAGYHKAFVDLHNLNLKQALTFPGGLPEGAMSETALVHAIEGELYRIGGNAFVGGTSVNGKLHETPNLPGAKTHDLNFIANPGAIPPLIDTIKAENERLLQHLASPPKPASLIEGQTHGETFNPPRAAAR